MRNTETLVWKTRSAMGIFFLICTAGGILGADENLLQKILPFIYFLELLNNLFQLFH